MLLRLLDLLVDLLARLAAVAVGLLTALVVSSALLRYVAGTPLRFGDELVSLLFLASVFLTLPKGTLRQNAVRVEVISSRLKGRAAVVCDLLAALILLTFAAWFGLVTYEFTAFNYEIDARTEQVGIPLWVWTMLMPLNLTVVAVVALSNILQAISQLLGNQSIERSL